MQRRREDGQDGFSITYLLRNIAGRLQAETNGFQEHGEHEGQYERWRGSTMD
jgi:hypothetical protein